MVTTPARPKSKQRFQWAASTMVFVLGGCAAGLMIGGAVGGLLARGSGVDQLADVLGGIGVGIMAGAILTLGLARRLSPLRRARIGSMLFLLSAIAFFALQARNRSAEPESHPVPERPVPERPVTEPVPPTG